MLRLVACALALEISPESELDPVSNADLTWILKKRPAEAPERSFRELMHADSEWQWICSEVVRTMPNPVA